MASTSKASSKNDYKASVLAFERKLDPSDALLACGQWSQRDQPDAWLDIPVREKSVRGTISNRLKAGEQDPAKLDAKIDNPNLQTVDVATLPDDADTLKVRFSLKVLGGAGIPSACNNPKHQHSLATLVEDYIAEYGFEEIAHRYACNLANGRFLWRNRMKAEDLEVRVSLLEHGDTTQTWTFDALELALDDFDPRTHAADGVSEIARIIAEALKGERHALLVVEAFARVGGGQEVYPSQELVTVGGGTTKGGKSKTLYSVKGTAGIHSQKVGNAIRTIDTWYPQALSSAGVGPIAVEPYGAVTTRGTAYRPPRQDDFYTLYDSWVAEGKTPTPDQQHFVLATLIRGGVFGEAQDKGE
ncbi:type I-F CRISPR-associated protein Csy3 [Halomonas cerina]|uniref:CRISPR-associated protein Csy3 n=1 Tax=Halomonas cerina TaxID=447424 RepID=A0A839VAD8_9GAMM|nr:type I-F CRISPR-associated protein Csy3 [Halomonas cerina]MBB3190930.1 CRISPR-associated protein Csy3 [Halomonas cerina]